MEIKTIRKQRIIVFFITIIFIGIFFYKPILWELIEKVFTREGSSHGAFIPLLSFYFIWLKKSKLKKIEMRSSLVGFIPIAVSLYLYFFTIGGEKFYFQALSFIILITGILLLFTGKDFFKELSFPILFLISMIPLPEGFYISMANFIRQLNLGGAIWVMSKTNLPFLKKGLYIFLPNSTLKVNIGCSGIRYLLSFFVFGIAYAYAYRKKLIQRILLIVFTIPLSIFAGIIRISSISFLAYYVGPHMAEYRPHVIISWFIFFIIGMSLIIFDKFMMKRRNRIKI